MRIHSTAPGKLVLLGEYAVLHGHPALVMAVNRRAGVEILNRKQGPSSIDAPEVEAIGLPFEILAGGDVDWLSNDYAAADRLKLFSHVLGALAMEIDYAQLGPFAVMLSTSEFFDEENAAAKLGLGSSAALTVALGSALVRLAGQERLMKLHDSWLSRLLAIHASFQGGLGSGLDIGAALRGGLIEYRKAPEAEAPEVERLAMPTETELLCVWSGRSTATPQYLAKLNAWQRANEREFERHMSALGRIAREGIDAVRAGNGARLCEAVGAYGGALAGLGADSGLDILSAEHVRIRALADSLGIAYKPCGAGGGDIGAAIATDPGKLNSLKERLAEIGFGTVSLRLDPNGLRVRLLED